jgi:hypothetical protein
MDHERRERSERHDSPGRRIWLSGGSEGTLWQVTKVGDETKTRNVTGVLFVPLTGEH